MNIQFVGWQHDRGSWLFGIEFYYGAISVGCTIHFGKIEIMLGAKNLRTLRQDFYARSLKRKKDRTVISRPEKILRDW